MEICETKNKTDKAFIGFLNRFKSRISKEKEMYLKDEKVYKRFPFDSKKKNDNILFKILNSKLNIGFYQKVEVKMQEFFVNII